MLFYTYNKKEKWKIAPSLSEVPDGVSFISALEKEDEEGTTYRGDLYFDFDSEDVTNSLRDTIKLIEILWDDFDIKPKVWFSGKKGFHVIVDRRYFLEDSNSFIELLPKIYGLMAKSLGTALKTLDTSIYSSGKGRLFRVPGNFRESSKMYKTQLTIEQLVTKDIDWIKKYSSTKHKGFELPGTPTLSKKLQVLFKASSLLVKSHSMVESNDSIENIVYSQDAVVPPCVQEIMKIGKKIQKDVNFNDAVLLLSTYFRGNSEAALSKSEEFINNWNSETYKSSRERGNFLEYMCGYAKDSDYLFSCNYARKIVGNSFCRDCPHSVIATVSDSVVIENNCYFVIGSKGELKQISNFIIVPSMKIDNNGDTGLAGEFRLNGGKVKAFAGFSNSHTKDRKKFLMFLPIEAWFSGNESVLQKIGSSLMAYPMNLIKMAPCYGLHYWKGAWYYVDNGGALNANFDKVYSVITDPNKVDLKVDLVSESNITEAELQVLKNNIWFNDPAVVVPILGWCAAAFLRPILKRYDPSHFKNFPLLQVFGLSGSGKSETLIMIRKMFGFLSQVGNYNSYTPFAKEKMLASSNLHPIFFDEFKRGLSSKSIAQQFMELARQVYGSIEGQKGQKDQTLRKYQRYNPVGIFGEETVSEKATMERVLFVSIDKFKSPQHLQQFKNFSSGNLGGLGRKLLHTVMNMSPEDITALLDAASNFVASYQLKVLDRQFDNLLMVAIGALLMGAVLEKVEEFKEGFEKYAEVFIDNFTTNDKSDITSLFEFVERIVSDSSYQNVIPLEITEMKVVLQFLIFDMEADSVCIDFKLMESYIYDYKGTKKLPTLIPDISSIDKLLRQTDAYKESLRISVKNNKLWMKIFSIEGLEKQGVNFFFLKSLIQDEVERKQRRGK